MSTTKTTRRSYTAAEKQRAITLAHEKGVVAAAREVGLPQTTLSNWLHPWTAPASKAAPPPPPEPAQAAPVQTSPVQTTPVAEPGARGVARRDARSGRAR